MDILLKPYEVAKLLQISQRTLHDLTKTKKIRAFRVGRQLRYTHEAIQEFLRSSMDHGGMPQRTLVEWENEKTKQKTGEGTRSAQT